MRDCFFAVERFIGYNERMTGPKFGSRSTRFRPAFPYLVVCFSSALASLLHYFVELLHFSAVGGPPPELVVGGVITIVLLWMSIQAIHGFGSYLSGPRVELFRFPRFGWFLFPALFIFFTWMLPNPRHDAFMKLGNRLFPLVDAIGAYHSENGIYPTSLDVLTPDYLEELPTTGMAVYPNYEYLVGETANQYDGNPWVIDMNVGYGMGFDRFLYFPLQNYPDNGYGGRIERMGGWAYVHE